jgi:hypothetical protein
MVRAEVRLESLTYEKSAVFSSFQAHFSEMPALL